MVESSYSTLFERYSRSTDGKSILGARLSDLIKKRISSKSRRIRVLDVGAGDGQITEKLAHSEFDIVAIEPNVDLFRQLNCRLKDKIECYNLSLEEFRGDSKFDVVVLSYVLDGIDQKEIGLFLEKIKSCLNEQGTVLVCTYVPGCGWDALANEVSVLTGARRKGGLCRVVNRISEFGHYLIEWDSFETNIWGNDVRDLIENLEFYFRKSNVDVEFIEDHLSRVIEKLVVHENDRAILKVREAIYELDTSVKPLVENPNL